MLIYFLSGFHEAIGDTIALSVSTPSHLRMIENMLNNGTEEYDTYEDHEVQSIKDETLEYQQNINFLMKTALAKVRKNLLNPEHYRMKI